MYDCIFLSESIITVIMEFRHVMVTSYNVEMVFAQSLLHYQTQGFQTFREKTNGGRVKFFAEAS